MRKTRKPKSWVRTIRGHPTTKRGMSTASRKISTGHRFRNSMAQLEAGWGLGKAAFSEIVGGGGTSVTGSFARDPDNKPPWQRDGAHLESE